MCNPAPPSERPRPPFFLLLHYGETAPLRDLVLRRRHADRRYAAGDTTTSAPPDGEGLVIPGFCGRRRPQNEFAELASSPDFAAAPSPPLSPPHNSSSSSILGRCLRPRSSPRSIQWTFVPSSLVRATTTKRFHSPNALAQRRMCPPPSHPTHTPTSTSGRHYGAGRRTLRPSRRCAPSHRPLFGDVPSPLHRRWESSRRPSISISTSMETTGLTDCNKR